MVKVTVINTFAKIYVYPNFFIHLQRCKANL